MQALSAALALLDDLPVNRTGRRRHPVSVLGVGAGGMGREDSRVGRADWVQTLTLPLHLLC